MHTQEKPADSAKAHRTRVLLWPVLAAVAAVVVVVVGVLVFLVATNALSIRAPFGSTSEESSTQVIESVVREEQVVLLSLGIEGIDEKRQNGTFLGLSIPGTERAVFIRYGFDAKLGIEGKDVKIEQRGEDSYLVTVPEFIFIGLEDPSYELAVESNGLLSWTTPEIDTLEIVNDLVDDEAKLEYLESEEDILKDQARAFYTGIISSVDPDADVEFKFESDAGPRSDR